MLILSDIGGDEHPDVRLLRLLRVIGNYGLGVCNVQGSAPPAPGTLETITSEFGIRYDDAAYAERLEALEQTAIAGYLARWSMTEADISTMLARCEADPTLRSRFAGPGAPSGPVWPMAADSTPKVKGRSPPAESNRLGTAGRLLFSAADGA